MKIIFLILEKNKFTYIPINQFTYNQRMDFITIILLGIGLAMDCFAVSISKGICAEELKVRPALKMSLLFGLFQGVMPLIGFGLGQTFAKQIKSIDHWVAFVILLLIGAKMIYESYKESQQSADIQICDTNLFKLSSLIMLAVATSIDALATGLVFVSFPEKIYIAAIIIGFISFSASMIGVKFGHLFGKKININVELFGGTVVILIGVKILIEHLFM